MNDGTIGRSQMLLRAYKISAITLLENGCNADRMKEIFSTRIYTDDLKKDDKEKLILYIDEIYQRYIGNLNEENNRDTSS